MLPGHVLKRNIWLLFYKRSHILNMYTNINMQLALNNLETGLGVNVKPY